MEQLSILLQPYKGFVGTAACVVTIGQFFSGILICRDIHRNGSTVGIPAIPFIGGIVVGIVLLKYALIVGDTAMVVVNATAIVLNVLYMLIFYSYSKDKAREIFKPLSYGIALIAIVLAYASWEDQTLIEYRYGFIITVSLLLLIGSPLLDLSEIIDKKDASSIPFPIVSTGTVVAILWLLYGIILLNGFLIVQNIVALVLCIIQLLLCFMYPKRTLSSKKED